MGSEADGGMGDATIEQAHRHFRANDYERARAVALAGLERTPDEVEWLRIAGRAEVELGLAGAVERLRRVADLLPEDPSAWQDLGDALAADGRTEEASAAFAKAVELDPDDDAALAQLGHAAHATGHDTDAIRHLSQAADRAPGASSAAISLVDLYRSVGRLEEALAVAERVAAADSDSAAAALDVADLRLAVGRHDDARRAFEQLREIDEIPEHEIYTVQALLLVELRRADWHAARELAREASALDPVGATADVVAFLDQRLGADAGAAPTPEDVEALLVERMEEHRRLHAEDVRLDRGAGA